MGTEKQPPRSPPEGEEPSLPLLDGGRVGVGGGATSAQTLGNILVSILGTGPLGLPYAFRVSGWLAGSLAVPAAALTIYYSMLLLVQCRARLQEDGKAAEEEEVESYGDLGEKAFGAAGRYVTETLIFFSYAGSAVAYFLFIAQNLCSLLPRRHVSSSALVFLLLLPLELGLSFVRSLALLAPFSAFADVCNVLAMAFIVKEEAMQLRGGHVRRRAFNGMRRAAFAGEVAVFSFEGFGLTLALERSMAKPKKFPVVLLLAFVGMSVAYAGFGAVGYLAYGDETMDIITLNLSNTWSAALVKVGLCIAIAFTFPVIIHPVHEIAENKLKSSGWLEKLGRISHRKEWTEWLGVQLVRLLVVAGSAVLAVLVPGFAAVVSFMGGTVCAMLSFVLPAAFHLKLMGSSLKLWQRLLDYIILSIGLVFTGCNIYASFAGHSTDL